jgi:hypothetical protein
MTLDAPLAAKATFTGNPVRPMVIAAAAQPYAAPRSGGPFVCSSPAAARARA